MKNIIFVGLISLTVSVVACIAIMAMPMYLCPKECPSHGICSFFCSNIENNVRTASAEKPRPSSVSSFENEMQELFMNLAKSAILQKMEAEKGKADKFDVGDDMEEFKSEMTQAFKEIARSRILKKLEEKKRDNRSK